ncbi:MAG: hypothetical protein HY910_05280 [Desulfarculus sp.]|nr:hypothetical protein [Desulfarculus sp.]
MQTHRTPQAGFAPADTLVLGHGPAPAWWLVGLAVVLLGLALLCGGEPGQAGGAQGGELALPPGARAILEPWPEAWERAVLRLDCAPGQDCAGLLAVAVTGGPEVPGQGRGQARYDLSRPKGRAWRVEVVNPGPRTAMVRQWRAVNFLAVNSRPPRLALLLGAALPGAGQGQALAGGAALALLLAPALVLWWRQGRRRGSWLFWGAALPPLAVLALTLGLWGLGLRLALAWETLALLGLPGLALALAQRPLWGLLLGMGALWGLLLATLLGVGLPREWFGPPLVQQLHYTYMCGLAALAQALLTWGLYRQRPAWLLPGEHPLIASLLWVAAPCLLFYLANGYTVFGGDATYNGLLAMRLLGGHGLYYGQAWVAAHGGWGLVEVGEHFLPTFPMGPGFLGLPTALLQSLLGGGPEHLLAAWNQKVTASWVAATAAMVMFQLVYRLGRRVGWAALLTLGFALGSSQLGICASTLWQHGPTVLFITLGLYCLLRGLADGDPRWLALAGLPLGCLPALRTQAVLFHLAGLAVVAWHRPRALPGFILFTLPGLAAFLALNLGLYGSIFGGYAYQAHGANFPTSLWEGLSGLLFSPNRGLLIFSPFVVLGLWATARLALKEPRLAWPLVLAMAGFLAVHAKFDGWYAGWCNGARYTAELVPVLVALLAWHYRAAAWRGLRWALGGLVGLAVLINLPLHLFVPHVFQWNIFPDIDQRVLERVWDWRDWQPLHFRHHLALGRGEVVPAFALARNQRLTPLPDPSLGYRVGVNLGQEPVEALKVVNLALGPGAYRFSLRGGAAPGSQAQAELTLDVINQEGRRQRVDLAPGEAWELALDFRVGRAGWVDLGVAFAGQGHLELTTAQVGRLGD